VLLLCLFPVDVQDYVDGGVVEGSKFDAFCLDIGSMLHSHEGGYSGVL